MLCLSAPSFTVFYAAMQLPRMKITAIYSLRDAEYSQD